MFVDANTLELCPLGENGTVFVTAEVGRWDTGGAGIAKWMAAVVPPIPSRTWKRQVWMIKRMNEYAVDLM